MADALLSAAAERLIALIKEQVVYHVNLVGGAENEVLSLAEELNTIRNVLNDAENRRFHDTSINSWLFKLEQASYQMEDVLDEWNYALIKRRLGASRKKVFSLIPSSSCLCLKTTIVRHHIATKILNVKARLDEIFKEKDRFGFVISQPTFDPFPESRPDQSTSLVGDVHGRDREGEVLVDKLIASDGSSHEKSGIPVVTIVGVGGLGKTTLAQLVYNNSQVEECFELRIWFCVSNPFDLVSIAKGILESIEKGTSKDAEQLDVLFKRVRESISGKKFLLVLDDVWTEDYNKWEPLENVLGCGGAGSKILVTTRSKRVAVTLGTRESEIFQLGFLSDEECWLVLSRMAILERDRVEFEDIGKKIAQKCSGLPLAAKTLGGLLRFKRSLREWENVLNSEIWAMQEVEDELFRPLLMSYKELSTTQKQCFLHCVVFPKDEEIDVKILIQFWMACGYLGSNSDDMEVKGKECFDVLAMRSLFQNFRNSNSDKIKFCMMHDIVHDFAQFLRKRGRVENAEMNKSTSCEACDPSQVSTVNEFLTMFDMEKSPPNLCNCLVRLRVLCIDGIGLQGVPNGMNNLIHLRCLGLSEYELSTEDLKIIFQLYHLQTLGLRSCRLKEIPKEIENLSDLRYLNLSNNELKELPSEIGNLEQLRHLNLRANECLKELPSEIGKLILLQTLKLPYLAHIPEALAQLTSLRKLRGFDVGSCGSKLGLLNKLTKLGGFVCLDIKQDGKDLRGIVEDAREAKLSNKAHIEHLHLMFDDGMEEMEESAWMDVIDALEPHPNLRRLDILQYKGSKLPRWIVLPPNQLRKVTLQSCHFTSLSSFGKLRHLEEIVISESEKLEFVGREFLGITTNTNFVAFPKLEKLTFYCCHNWKEWEDITAEEEESPVFQALPCLKKLLIISCEALTALPHRLLHKTSSLEALRISGSVELQKRYGSRDGPFWESLYLNNPRLQRKR